MAYQNGQTYYLMPKGIIYSSEYKQKILKKEVQPPALNIYGYTSSVGYYNNRNVNLWNIDYTTDMQWKVQLYDGYAHILCAGNTAFGLDYYYGADNPGNCDIYKVIGNTEDSKINFRTVDASNNLYRIQCYRNNADNDLYLTATSLSEGADVRWEKLDSNKDDKQIWWLIPIEDIKGDPSTPVERTEVKVTNMPSGSGYDSQGLTEIFHPDAGMINGTWAENNGSVIETQIKNFYTTVYGVTPSSKLKYLYSLYGGKFTSGIYIGEYHPGVDINYYHGAPIKPSRSGEVVDKGNYYVTVKSGDEYLIYVHLAPSSDISKGDYVVKGQTILGTQSCLGLGLTAAEVAAGKNSHLHIEVHKASLGNTKPQPPTPTVEEYMIKTISPYVYLNS